MQKIQKKNAFCGGVLVGALLLTACSEPAAQGPAMLPLASCPIESSATVLRASYDNTSGSYLIFHTPAGPLPNPVSFKNLPMVQLPSAPNSTTGSSASSADFARLTFSRKDEGCYPVLEMTQGYKIELIAANTPAAGGGGQYGGGGGEGSFWAPFLMGAMAGQMLSRPSMPAYYLPPPASPNGGGLVTGGVSGSSPADLDKKYENTYKQPPPTKKGFFSRNNSSSTAASNAPADKNAQKKGFFSGGRGNSGSKGGGFFRKKR